jgi:hypothetical protein
VGPVLDVVLAKTFCRTAKGNLTALCRVLSFERLELCLPSVFDALLVMRPVYNFRDGTTLANSSASLVTYLMQIPFHDSFALSLLSAISGQYAH